MRIAVAGQIRSGKDTFSSYLINTYSFKKFYFAEGIEDVIKRYFPELWDENNKPRELYQKIGQWFREIDPDVWIKCLDKKLESYFKYGENAKVIVTDLRQLNEYNYLKSKGFVIVKVEADEEVRIERVLKAGDKFSRESLYHETEIQVATLPCDYLVTNNTTLEDLFEQADFIYNEVKDIEGL